MLLQSLLAVLEIVWQAIEYTLRVETKFQERAEVLGAGVMGLAIQSVGVVALQRLELTAVDMSVPPRSPTTSAALPSPLSVCSRPAPPSSWPASVQERSPIPPSTPHITVSPGRPTTARFSRGECGRVSSSLTGGARAPRGLRPRRGATERCDRCRTARLLREAARRGGAGQADPVRQRCHGLGRA